MQHPAVAGEAAARRRGRNHHLVGHRRNDLVQAMDQTHVPRRARWMDRHRAGAALDVQRRQQPLHPLDRIQHRDIGV